MGVTITPAARAVAYAFPSRQAPAVGIPRDFIMLCLWAACGLAVSGLMLIAGFGAEITRALAAAG